MLLVASNGSSQDFAVAWDGTSWGSSITLDSGSGDDRTDINVAYESLSGEAVVTFGQGGTNLQTVIWDGDVWGTIGAYAPPSGATGNVRWTTVASDPNSDRIAVGVLTSNNDIWVGVWSGSTWTEKVLATATSAGTTYPNVAVAFESNSGDILTTYGINDTSIRYRTWNSVDGWSGQKTGTNLGDTPNSMILASDPESDTIMLAVQDGGNDLTYAAWTGSAWGIVSQQSGDTGETKNQPFLFLWDQSSGAANSLPTIANPIVDQLATQDTPFSFQFAANSFDDADGDTLTYSASQSDSSPLPAWLSFDAATRTFSGTPGNTDVGAITVRVTADDGNDGSVFDDFQLTVNDVNDPPFLTVTTLVGSLPENTPILSSIALAMIHIHDDAVGSAVLSLSGTDSWMFEIVGNELRLKAGAVLDHELSDGRDVQINVDDLLIAGGPEDSAVHALLVTDVNEAPGVLSLSNSSIDGDVPGAVVGPLTLSDPDVGDTHTWSVDDSRFEIVGNLLRLKPTISIDHIAEPVLSLRITATDLAGAGISRSQSFTIQVNASEIQPLPPDLTSSNQLAMTFGSEAASLSDDDHSRDESFASKANALVGKLTAPAAQRTRTTPYISPVMQQEQMKADAKTARNGDRLDVEFGGVNRSPRHRDVRPSVHREVESVTEASYQESAEMILALDTLKQEFAQKNFVHTVFVGSSLAVGTSLSVGYVVWLIRGGVLVSSLISSLPAWQSIDPLPILGCDQDEAEDQNGESLESLVTRDRISALRGKQV